MEEKTIDKNSGSALIDRILADAQATAERNVSDAVKYRDESIAAAEERAAAYVEGCRAASEETAAEMVGRMATLARIEANKTLLAAKQNLVEEVYIRAQKMLEGLDKKEYLELIAALVEKFAEAGDTVVLSKNCPLSVGEVEAVSKVKKLSLKVVKTGDFSGGLILSGDKADKDLTFAALVNGVRERTETGIAQKLFG